MISASKESDPITEISKHAFDLFGTIDRAGRVIEIQGRLFEGTNIEPARLAGQVFAETVFWQSTESTSRAVIESVESALNGEVVKLDVNFRATAKEKIPVEITFVPSPAAEGLFVFARRLSVSPDAAGSTDPASQLLFAAENAEIGLWHWNFMDKSIRSTVKCSEILGLEHDETLTYDTFLAAVHPDDRESVNEFVMRAGRSPERYEYAFRIISRDGNPEWVAAEGKAFLSESGKPERMVGVVRRITEEKRAAEELEAVYARERTARDEAEDANRAKDVFLAFVSHELRAPLNAILGWSNILLTKDVDENTRHNALSTIERSARMQTKLINDLVDSARVASGKIRLEYRPTDVLGVVNSAFEAQRPLAENRGIEYSIESNKVEAIVMGDTNRLQQVFTNLLSNAIKFTSPGGAVRVELSTEVNEVNVTISDTGEGISTETLPNIFKQFSQVGAGEGRGVGLGLGLSIAKTLVERHGGQLHAESGGVGKGSRFVVTLPVLDSREVENTISEPAAQKPRRLSGLTILIVEDEKDSRDVLRLFLENNGARVLECDAAAKAFDVLAKGIEVPDLIISDIGMPDEDGLSFMDRVRKSGNQAITSIPAIALSAFATSEFKENALNSGFQRYVTKPFDPETLVDIVLEQIGTNSK